MPTRARLPLLTIAVVLMLTGSLFTSGPGVAVGGGTVSGLVEDTDTRTPQPGIAVAIEERDSSAGTWSTVDSTVTGADGRYRFSDIGPGSYRVTTVDPTDRYFDGSGADGLIIVRANASDNFQINFDLLRYAAIQGDVFTDTGSTSAGLVITLYDNSGDVAASTVAQDYRYHFDGLSPGSYRVGFSDPEGRYRTQFYAGPMSAGTYSPANTLVAATAINLSALSDVRHISGAMSTTAQVRSLGKPIVRGIPEVGKTLTVSSGTHDPAEATVAYQWRRNGHDILGETASTYELTAADQGRSGGLLVALVTASYPGLDPVVGGTFFQKTVRDGSFKCAINVDAPRRLAPGSVLSASVGDCTTEISWQTVYWEVRLNRVRRGAIDRPLRIKASDKGARVTLLVSTDAEGYRNFSYRQDFGVVGPKVRPAHGRRIG